MPSVTHMAKHGYLIHRARLMERGAVFDVMPHVEVADGLHCS
jgi:hypothetical protein